jgi:hypothetical protein
MTGISTVCRIVAVAITQDGEVVGSLPKRRSL